MNPVAMALQSEEDKHLIVAAVNRIRALLAGSVTEPGRASREEIEWRRTNAEYEAWVRRHADALDASWAEEVARIRSEPPRVPPPEP
jgi:hypothetical protein